MELAHQMKLRRMLLRARWLPRLQNQEADDLTNEEFRHFDPAKRISVDLKSLGFEVMDSLFKVGDDYLADLEKMRESEKRKAESKKHSASLATAGKARKTKTLRESDPW